MNEKLEDLYLMGNPCTEWDGWRAYVIYHLPQLRQLDGKTVTPTERIESERLYRRGSLRKELLSKIKQKEEKERERQQSKKETSETAYTRENRKKMYLDMAKVRRRRRRQTKGTRKTKEEKREEEKEEEMKISR
ncbi:leucine rich repeat-containing protein, partial [Cystoisospora suis]